LTCDKSSNKFLGQGQKTGNAGLLWSMSLAIPPRFFIHI